VTQRQQDDDSPSGEEVRLLIVPLDTIIKHEREKERRRLSIDLDCKREERVEGEGFKYFVSDRRLVVTIAAVVDEVMVVGVTGAGDIGL